jgi:methylthioribose-1-phosphate isomerase
MPYRAIWIRDDRRSFGIIDQTKLPHEFVTETVGTVEQAAHAICAMRVRGAPLIGATAAHGLWLALEADASDGAMDKACRLLESTRPTAVNLLQALGQMREALSTLPPSKRAAAGLALAADMADADVARNRALGEHGWSLLQAIAGRAKGRPQRALQIMTHCNAGWLATVDGGTALAPVYAAHDAGMPVHVWVSETRPRNQGAFLTAWELEAHGISHTLIVDNAAGHFLQRGEVDVVIVGTDRTTAVGDVANKIGT